MLSQGKNMRWLTLGCFLFGLAASGCQTDAFCFNCHASTGTGGGGSVDVPDGMTIIIPPDEDTGAPPTMPDAGPKPPCSADLGTDPNNCGACGNVCSYPGAFPKCVDGKCQFDKCADGLVDVNQDLSDGCECTVTNGGTEICDDIDNDCNGTKDDGFDLQTDVNNCGDCNTPCPELPHSAVSCTKGRCGYDCEAGYENLGQRGVGCPYKCPVVPSIPEACNGIDDDCDGVIDDGDPGAGVPCDDNCPEVLDTSTGTMVKKCVGECQPGTTVCSGTSDGVVCVGGTRPNPELCDSKDNDCNGVVDDAST